MRTISAGPPWDAIHPIMKNKRQQDRRRQIPVQSEKTDKEKSERFEKSEITDRTERFDRSDRTERSGGSERFDRTDRTERSGRSERFEGPENSLQSAKSDKKIIFAAICGVKNSGKTTLTEGIIRTLTARGLKTAVIKHDGHEFECDIAGTDSSRFVEAGAFGAAVFSRGQIFVRKTGQYPDTRDMEGTSRLLKQLITAFPEADVILAEGLKGLPVPKIEVVRRAVSQKPVSNPTGRFLVVSDLSREEIGETTLPFEDLEGITDAILQNAQ